MTRFYLIKLVILILLCLLAVLAGAYASANAFMGDRGWLSRSGGFIVFLSLLSAYSNRIYIRLIENKKDALISKFHKNPIADIESKLARDAKRKKNNRYVLRAAQMAYEKTVSSVNSTVKRYIIHIESIELLFASLGTLLWAFGDILWLGRP